MSKISDLKNKWMEDSDFRQAYTEADSDYRVVEALIRARERAGLTQSQLAQRLHTTQSAIARLESGCGSPKLDTLRRYAEATGSKLVVEMQAA